MNYQKLILFFFVWFAASSLSFANPTNELDVNLKMDNQVGDTVGVDGVSGTQGGFGVGGPFGDESIGTIDPGKTNV